MSQVQRLLIVSHVVHYRWQGQLFAYGPYAREIDIWADLFPQVVIAAPCRQETPPGECIAIDRANVKIAPQWELGGDSAWEKIGQLLMLPCLTWGLCRALWRADAIHLRCPGNIGLLGAILAPLFSRKLIAKYAGQWGSFPGETLAARWQRAILASRWWRGPVTVYGNWPHQPPHIIPFFTSLLTHEYILRAKQAADGKQFAIPLRVLFVGRLTTAKNVDVLLSALSELARAGVELTCQIIGDGPERKNLEALAANLHLADRVEFAGGMDHQLVLDRYERADVLVLVSETEGWPKAITEAMAFGLICIGGDRGLVPEMLGEGRGFVVPPRDVAALVAALRQIAATPNSNQDMSARAAAWAQRYSLDGLKTALQDLLAAQWHVTLTDRRPTPSVRREVMVNG